MIFDCVVSLCRWCFCIVLRFTGVYCALAGIDVEQHENAESIWQYRILQRPIHSSSRSMPSCELGCESGHALAACGGLAPINAQTLTRAGLLDKFVARIDRAGMVDGVQ